MQTILVIDDDPMNLRMAEFMLKQQGYNIITCSNGRDGISLMESDQVDLVLLDIEMPEFNGFDTLSEIKSNSAISSIPVIMLTASAEKEDIEKSTALGAVDYIKKPFKPQELSEIISRAI